MAARAPSKILKATSRILVGGGTGFIGRALCKTLENYGYIVTCISRTPGKSKITWDYLKKSKKLPECDAVISLAGENIMNPLRRWTPQYQSDIRTSRIETTQLLADLISKAENPPRIWISSSAEGFYPTDSSIEEFTEDSPPPQNHNFITKLCYDWENAARLPADHLCRSVTIRIGLVLGRDGGTVQAMIWPFWFGLGGTIGSGQQPFSWIHISDTVGIFLHALENEVSGVLNAVAPQCITNEQFTKAFAAALCRPAFIPVPGAVLNTLLGSDRSSLMLNGKNIIPKRTLESGYHFLFPDIESCLQDIVK